jgi:transcriptional regulator with XRE-family HTH domain
MGTVVRFDVERILYDMADRGWIARDLARVSGVSDMTVSRFLRGDIQTARTAAKLARALGYSPRRYVLRSDQGAAA